MSMRYKLQSFTMQRSGWIEFHEKETIDYAKTKSELDILIEIVNEDKSIISAFYTDLANNQVTYIKP